MATHAEVAARIMEHLCTHNGGDGHGYTQGARWGVSTQEFITVDGKRYYFNGGDRDCSSAVISAYKAAGLDVSATYTGNMLDGFLRTGHFEWKPMRYTAQRGDIYLNIQNHTAMCTSPNPDLLAEFSISENGTIYGRQGDQTGRESLIRGYYDYPWNGILHYKGGQATPTKPTGDEEPAKIRWKLLQGGAWSKENYTGTKDQPITGLAIDLPGWYQVCTEDHGWLEPVRGYDITDERDGYAGWKNSPIIAARVYYETPNPEKTGYRSAKYRVSDVGMAGFYPWQFDNDTWNGQDGYAGDFKRLDQFELTIE